MKGYRTLILNAGIALAMALCSFLVGVDWTQYVSPSFAVLIVAAANAGLRFFTSTPVGTAQSPVTTVNKQSGYFRLDMAIGLAIGVLLLTVLAACASLPQTPRQVLLASYETLDTYTQSIASAKASGLIDAAERDRLLGQVKETYTFLEDARLSLAGMPNTGAGCADTTSCLQLAQQLLLQIQSSLPKEAVK